MLRCEGLEVGSRIITIVVVVERKHAGFMHRGKHAWSGGANMAAARFNKYFCTRSDCDFIAYYHYVNKKQ